MKQGINPISSANTRREVYLTHLAVSGGRFFKVQVEAKSSDCEEGESWQSEREEYDIGKRNVEKSFRHCSSHHYSKPSRICRRQEPGFFRQH